MTLKTTNFILFIYIYVYMHMCVCVYIYIHTYFPGGTTASLVAQMVKHLPESQEIWVQSLGQENPLYSCLENSMV